MVDNHVAHDPTAGLSMAIFPFTHHRNRRNPKLAQSTRLDIETYCRSSATQGRKSIHSRLKVPAQNKIQAFEGAYQKDLSLPLKNDERAGIFNCCLAPTWRRIKLLHRELELLCIWVIALARRSKLRHYDMAQPYSSSYTQHEAAFEAGNFR